MSRGTKSHQEKRNHIKRNEITSRGTKSRQEERNQIKETKSQDKTSMKSC